MTKTKQDVIFSIFILSICYGITTAADSPCGDWEPYKDYKCFKVSDKYGTEENAEKTCNQEESGATLVIILSKDEQDFLSNLLFKTHKIVDNVWIGAKHTSNNFKWIDDSDLNFANWAEGSPSNKTDHDCVQIEPDGSSMGKWVNVPCNKNNKVVCQKMQNWSISSLQKTLLNARKELQDSLEDVKKQLKESKEDRKQLNSSLEDIKKNPVPINFIYVQLPSQPEPKTLWSIVEWKDVTSDYAGLFFRAEGGGSALFESIQDEDSPKVVSVQRMYYNNNTALEEPTKFSSGSGSYTKILYTGDYARPGYYDFTIGLRFELSNGEVRPRNKAIRIWKRTK